MFWRKKKGVQWEKISNKKTSAKQKVGRSTTRKTEILRSQEKNEIQVEGTLELPTRGNAGQHKEGFIGTYIYLGGERVPGQNQKTEKKRNWTGIPWVGPATTTFEVQGRSKERYTIQEKN